MLALLLVVSCQSSSESEGPAALTTPQETEGVVPTPAVPAPAAVEPTPTTTPPPSPTAPVEPTATDQPADLAISADNVRLYPVPYIVSGDRVTFQVMPHVPAMIPVSDVVVDIYVDGQVVSTGTLASRNWAGEAEGIFEWVWDTRGLFGEHQVRVVLDAQDEILVGDEDLDNNETTFPVRVRKVSERPLEERDAAWITADTDCCRVSLVTRTTAYRDLPELLEAVENAVAQAAIKLQEEPDQKLDVFFIDKTIGQGGFAGSEMTVTYIDRPYSGGNLHELMVHEAVHVLDRQFAPQRIKFLAEGVAVWASGGHYKAEDLDLRTAALQATGAYIPLSTLIDNFYQSQHEIGYLQAGAFVKYLVDQFGYPTFREFYSDTTASDADTEAEALDRNLRAYYGYSLADMESEWLQFLATLPVEPAQIEDLQTTIRYYEVMRRYQEQYDPTAHFLGAWLPSPLKVRESGNTADLTRHPQEDINIALEVMLSTAESALLNGEFGRANVMLDSLERILNNQGAFADPLSGSYLSIVQVATAFGYEVQDVDLQGDMATVLATTASGVQLRELDFERRRGDWILLAN